MGVILGLILAVATGWLILDPLLAALVAAAILWQGWRLIRSSVGGLMDEAVDDATLADIRRTIAENAGGAIEAHDLRTRRAGRMTFIEFHLVVPGTMAVSVSHDICDRIERALQRAGGRRADQHPRRARGEGEAHGRGRGDLIAVSRRA